MTGDLEPNKRQRVSKACDPCRKKKVKCDGGIPICRNCETLNIACLYKETTKKRGPPKGYIEAVEGRLHRLEALLNSIIQEDDPHSQAILNELNSPLETAYGELVRPRPIFRERIPDYNTCSGLLRLSPDPSTSRPSVTAKDNNSDSDYSKSLGNLSIDESGQLRYYGGSSGFYMLKTSKSLQNRAFHFNSKDYIAKNNSSNGKRRIDTGLEDRGYRTVMINPYELPPKDLSDHLLELYFNNFYPLLPLLHKQSFLQSLQDDRKANPPALLLNAIYAVASRISSDVRVRADPLKADTAGDIFFERARLLLDLEWDSFRVYTVQSLLLMSSHQNGALKPTRGWLYSGMAIRMSQNLGLHRNCDHWNLTPSEKEERKRVFYCCFVLDRLSSAMHGRSPMIDDRDYDTPYPSENDDDDITRTPRTMENFHHLIRICERLGDVIRDLYMVRGRKQLAAMPSADIIVSKLDKRLNSWLSNLPADLQYHPPNTRLNEKAPAPALEVCQLHMLFYTTSILTHRPFIPGPRQATAPSIFPSASICTFAANKILDITESLMNEGRLKNVNNYTLFFMFTAGIIFIHNAASTDSMFAFEAKISINKIMHAMDEVEKTWTTSARHCNILGALAGLRDIDLDCVDESYIKLRRNDVFHQPASIAVPNSPEPEDKIILDNNVKGQQQIEEEYYRERLHSTVNDGGVSSVITFDDRSISSDFNIPSVSIYNGQSPKTTQCYTHQQQPQKLEQTNSNDNIAESNPFDPNTSAFWSVPMSFDIDEWNSYFDKQKLSSNSNNEVNYILNGSSAVSTDTVTPTSSSFTTTTTPVPLPISQQFQSPYMQMPTDSSRNTNDIQIPH
ncbi:fungal-specific transcription factor domain-containing protein [Mycotypha africana]|uniref:fungal-specific transcription factor domain-containing protein n=1 Tax=Mycotypha africana TaxID=64632 RepID=UPI0023007554|nr:fungal-specific transcription factor domain-containing protein [Mycotypha africana]KAI8977276.1 fungal-specific transcription factor domain-containing protein [Mycotypha africana]